MISDDQIVQAVPSDDQPAQPPPTSEADYEQMYHLLYTYRLGAIGFLELLDRFEELLHITG